LRRKRVFDKAAIFVFHNSVHFLLVAFTPILAEASIYSIIPFSFSWKIIFLKIHLIQFRIFREKEN
jgi:hypothetical protein